MKTNLIQSALVTTLLSAALLAGPANAASKCKGLENAACNSAAACGWVNQYERKDGRTVKGFCRTSTRGKAKATSKTDTASKNGKTG